MSMSVEKIGRTIEEAVSLALEELKTEKSNVNIEVIDEGNKGLFGLLGSKQARVKVTVKNSTNSRIEKFLKDIFSEMELEVDIKITETAEKVMVELSGENMGILIGRRGETLDALQYLASVVANKGGEGYKKVMVDTENYRQKREETLVRLAHRVADRVIRYNKSVTLEPMNPYERRIIHSALQDNKSIETYSVGEEPNRKVVIALR